MTILGLSEHLYMIHTVRYFAKRILIFLFVFLKKPGILLMNLSEITPSYSK